MNPYVELTQPYMPPAHAIAASVVAHMVTIQHNNIDWVYEVGKAPRDFTTGFSISNRCIKNELKVTITYPNYMVTDTPSPFILPPQETYNVLFRLNESEAKNRVISGNKLFTEDMTIEVMPLNVTGPVYVKV